ncbi:HRDC domain-containing protein, partial [Sphingobium yanoikuyae]
YLSAVYRTGQSFGAGHIEAVLSGAVTDKIRERGHDKISVYAIVDGDETTLLRPVSRALLVRDALETTEHGGLMLGPNARPILRGEEEVRILVPPRRERKKRNARNGSDANPVGDPLFDALRTCRRELAQDAGVPPYVIFHDSTLREMAEQRPATIHELGMVSGVGQKKLDAYGDAFLAAIRPYL